MDDRVSIEPTLINEEKRSVMACRIYDERCQTENVRSGALLFLAFGDSCVGRVCAAAKSHHAQLEVVGEG
jgi:hypothetical protein